MESETLSSLPQLGLNPQQLDIITQHMGDAITKLSSIHFKTASKEDAILFYVYNSGRKDMALEILNFDANLEKARQEQTTNSQTEGR